LCFRDRERESEREIDRERDIEALGAPTNHGEISKLRNLTRLQMNT